MRLLVLTAFYPVPNGTHERMFVHVRNKYYIKNGLDVTVLNFATHSDYVIEGVNVISLNSYQHSNENYDIAVCHSANLRNHYRFMKKYTGLFRHIVFFFHGHEVLYLTKDYPRPYTYMEGNNPVNRIIQNVYDHLKISIWKRYYGELAEKSEFVFVSNWILQHFKKNTGLSEIDLFGHCHIINNSIGSVFEKTSYNPYSEKKYDFITIRSNLDGSKYCVDIVVRMAKENPQCRFLLIGRGEFFNYNSKPENLEWISRSMNHDEIISYLNASRCGILMTREDTQGVMTCELAAFGIPVITSDIEVCHEFFETMPNVAIVSNDESNLPIVKISRRLREGLSYPKETAYFAENTIRKEVELYKRIMETV